MDASIHNEEALRRYLLGQLDEEEQTRIEETYFDDGEFFALLQTIEGELIDHYVGKGLSEKDRQDFENYFLQSTDRRRRVEFAEAFRLYVEKAAEAKVLLNPKSAQIPTKPASQKSFFDFLRFHPVYLLPVAASLILTFGFVYLFIETGRLRNQLQEAQQTLLETQQKSQELQDKLSKEQEQTAQLEKKLADARNQGTKDPENGTGTPNPLSQIVAVILSTGGVRDQGGIKKIPLFENTETLKVTMPFVGGEEKKVSASLKRASNEVINRADLTVKSSGSKKQVVWSLPAQSLGEGDYLITLTGTNEAGETSVIDRYAFRIIKK